MTKRESVGIGMIGAGFLAETRARCYAQVGGYDARLLAVAARTPESASAYAARHQVAHTFTDYRELLSLPEVDVVDLCVPNHLHRPMTEAAAAAGKHIICTKPLSAYIGQDLHAGGDEAAGGDEGAAVGKQSRQRMLNVAVNDARAMVMAAEAANVQLMYGENWVYAPSVQKARRLLESSKGAILEMRGGECHSGSHSAYSKRWCYTGGGALIRLGAHPIGAMIYLKIREGLARNGRPILPAAVTAEVADTSLIVPDADRGRGWVTDGWEDVENWASVLLSFDDGSRAIVYASDAVLGGMESRLELFLSNARIACNMSPNNLVQAYAPDPDIFSDEYLLEKLETRAGWSTPMPDEDWSSGHLAMCQDFVGAIAEKRPALADGYLGLAVTQVVYSAYLAASEGRRVTL